MKYSEKLIGMLKGNSINPEINPSFVRTAVENHLDYIKKCVIDDIGSKPVTEDVKLVCEEVNDLYKAKTLYNTFMEEYEEFLNQEMPIRA